MKKKGYGLAYDAFSMADDAVGATDDGSHRSGENRGATYDESYTADALEQCYYGRSHLINAKLFNGFTEDELDVLFSTVRISPQLFRRKEALILQGERAPGIVIIESGTVFSEKTHFDGSSPRLMHVYHSLDVILADAYFSDLRTSPTSIVGANTGQFVWISGLESILQKNGAPPRLLPIQHQFMQNVASILADETIRANNRTDAVAHHKVRDQVLTYLSNVTERKGSLTVDIGMVQSELAHYLGVSRATLSVELHRMREDGLIDYKGKVYTLLRWK
ncbi:MAG: Crp/Fnr family transcriptional regulator [Clostridiales Family XIII bacterium]|jgi:CRP-like cAMP-binding protein|nr:Crp/Fnr family transcriptional regulator [Clostridiales Family XIII bacterium]